MAEDDFSEDFDDELPEEFREEEPAARPAPRKAPPQRAPPQRPQPQPQRQPVQVQAPASAPVQTQKVKYVPFVLPARAGIYDNEAGKPLMEDPDKMDLILGLLTEILNRINNIEQNL